MPIGRYKPEPEKRITSKDIKLSLMKYFRFQRQWICATECLNFDVVAFTGKDVHEVEVKVSKSDLWKGEAKKWKHGEYRNSRERSIAYHPTKFSVCVPENLQETAEEWVLKTNPDYGVAVYQRQWDRPIWVRTARRIRDDYNEDWLHRIMMRVCTENITMMEKQNR